MRESYKLIWKHLLEDVYISSFRCIYSLYFCLMNFCTIQRRCRNLLLCFRLDARISNILIFMCHFSHQTNKRFYLHSIIVNVVPVKADRKPKTDMHVVRGHLKSTFVEVRGEGGKVYWKANKNEQGEGTPSICVRSLF